MVLHRPVDVGEVNAFAASARATVLVQRHAMIASDAIRERRLVLVMTGGADLLVRRVPRGLRFLDGSESPSRSLAGAIGRTSCADSAIGKHANAAETERNVAPCSNPAGSTAAFARGPERPVQGLPAFLNLHDPQIAIDHDPVTGLDQVERIAIEIRDARHAHDHGPERHLRGHLVEDERPGRGASQACRVVHRRPADDPLAPRKTSTLSLKLSPRSS